jgi:arylsulfatase A-like enzyme
VPLIVTDGYSYRHPFEESPESGGFGRVVVPGRFNTNLVQTLDVFATAAAIARGDDSSGEDSISLLPYLKSATASPRRELIFAESRPDQPPPAAPGTPIWTTCGDPGWHIAVRDAQYKLIVKNYGSDRTTAADEESYELYDLSADRWETTDLLLDGGMSDAERTIRDTLKAAIDTLLGTSACLTK